MANQRVMSNKKLRRWTVEDASLRSHLSSYKRFVIELEASVQDELASSTARLREAGIQLPRGGKEWNRIEEQKQRATVCNEALGKLLELQPASGDLLTDVISEYEKFISVLSQGQAHLSFLHEEVKRSHTDPLTLLSLEKRKAELSKRIAILTENNRRLEVQLIALDDSSSLTNKTKSKVKETEKPSTIIQSSIADKYPLDKPKIDQYHNHSLLRIVSMSAATDIGMLVKYSTKLQAKIKKLKMSLRSEYGSKVRLGELKAQLGKKEIAQHHLRLYNARLKEQFQNLTIAVESLKGVVVKPDKPLTLSKVVINAFEDHTKSSLDQLAFRNFEAASILEDDDPAKKRKAEIVMEYMDAFNEMISLEKYEQAAKHAANSPKGTLRTFDTMKTFKQIDAKMNGGDSTAMMFCEALMATSQNAEIMSGGLSCEVLRCALNANRLDLASHWLSKKRFAYSLPMGNMLRDYCKCQCLCQCGCIDLAGEIFAQLRAHRQASSCFLATGKIHQMLQYGDDNKFSLSDYIYLCRQYPSTKLILFLLSNNAGEKQKGLISFPMAINILLQCSNKEVFSEILQEVSANGLVSADGSRKTLADLLLAETKDDDMTKSKWQEVVEFCLESSLGEIALELFSVLIVRETIDIAAFKYLLDYIS